jgi:hypothetical protein
VGRVEECDEDQFCISREDHGLPFHEGFLGSLAQHLADDSTVILMRAGLDCSGYPSASAVAVNCKGETVRVDLEDIYQKAKKLGGTFEQL